MVSLLTIQLGLGLGETVWVGETNNNNNASSFWVVFRMEIQFKT